MARSLLICALFFLLQEVDDEGFLEIAIALSLQDPESADNPTAEDLINAQAMRVRGLQTIQDMSGDGAQAGPSHQVSDAGPSAGGSDDDTSNATALRTPPGTDQVISESTGSTTGDNDSTADAHQETDPRAEAGESSNMTQEQEHSEKIYVLRCTILEKMIDKMDLKLDNVGGVQAIPFMQVIHLLTMDLDGSSELGQRVMYKLLTAFIKKLEMVSSTPASEVSE